MSKKYYIFNKPYTVLSQFTKEAAHHITLQDFLDVEKDVYPIGRLDKDSEGLLLLTNDNTFKNRLLDPKFRSQKTYCAQLDGAITQDGISKLQQGVQIKLKKGYYKTQECTVELLDTVDFQDRVPPVRFRAAIPTSWISITIHEGKNRQIRKMCASVGFPVLRLIRTAIKGETFNDVELGTFRKLSEKELFSLRSK